MKPKTRGRGEGSHILTLTPAKMSFETAVKALPGGCKVVIVEPNKCQRDVMIAAVAAARGKQCTTNIFEPHHPDKDMIKLCDSGVELSKEKVEYMVEVYANVTDTIVASWSFDIIPEFFLTYADLYLLSMEALVKSAPTCRNSALLSRLVTSLPVATARGVMMVSAPFVASSARNCFVTYKTVEDVAVAAAKPDAGSDTADSPVYAGYDYFGATFGC